MLYTYIQNGFLVRHYLINGIYTQVVTYGQIVALHPVLPGNIGNMVVVVDPN